MKGKITGPVAATAAALASLPGTPGRLDALLSRWPDAIEALNAGAAFPITDELPHRLPVLFAEGDRPEVLAAPGWPRSARPLLIRMSTAARTNRR
jgi:hypothetical protein